MKQQPRTSRQIIFELSPSVRKWETESSLIDYLTSHRMIQAAPFTVRSTPDSRNTNGMEQQTVTWF
jgi:hypothetical protein